MALNINCTSLRNGKECIYNWKKKHFKIQKWKEINKTNPATLLFRMTVNIDILNNSKITRPCPSPWVFCCPVASHWFIHLLGRSLTVFWLLLSSVSAKTAGSRCQQGGGWISNTRTHTHASHLCYGGPKQRRFFLFTKRGKKKKKEEEIFAVCRGRRKAGMPLKTHKFNIVLQPVVPQSRAGRSATAFQQADGSVYLCHLHDSLKFIGGF